MFTHFEQPRRKLGAVTLAITCALMMGWLRSELSQDTLSLNGQYTSTTIPNLSWPFITSHAGKIEICFFEPIEAVEARWERRRLEGNPPEKYEGWWYSPITIEPFTLGSGRIVGGGQALIIPYWSVVIPLTLHSGWLLLSKPRDRKPGSL